MILVKSQRGITLLEVLLVLAIGAAIAFLSIRMYSSLVLDQNIAQVTSTVNSLFTAMSSYYKTNCDDQRDQTGTVIQAGALSPTTLTYPPTTSIVVDIPTQLSGTANGNFLSIAPILNPIVDDTAGNTGYIVQFNPLNPGADNTPGSINQYACWNYGNSTSTSYDTGPYANSTVVCSDSATQPSSPNAQPIPASQVILWQSQVAVKLKDNLDAPTFQNLLAADCTSTTASGGTIAPCSANTPGQYLVWERMPSLGSPRTSSGYLATSPILNEFTRQYTHDPMYEMFYSSINTTWPDGGQPYYLCGG